MIASHPINFPKFQVDWRMSYLWRCQGLNFRTPSHHQYDSTFFLLPLLIPQPGSGTHPIQLCHLPKLQPPPPPQHHLPAARNSNPAACNRNRQAKKEYGTHQKNYNPNKNRLETTTTGGSGRILWCVSERRCERRERNWTWVPAEKAMCDKTWRRK